MEFVVDWNAVCLVCLQEGEMHSIYDKDVKDIRICDKIMQCSNIEIQLGMNLPEQICSNCCEDLDSAYRFRTNCESSNIILKSLISHNSDLEIPAGNGQIYKYRPPSGLNVKRITYSNTSQLKEEFQEIETEDLSYVISEHFESNDDIHDELDAPISSLNIEEGFQEDSREILIKTELKSPTKSEENYEEEHLIEYPIENEREKRSFKNIHQRRGRPKTKKLESKSNENTVSNNVKEATTTIRYIRRVREDDKPLKICELCGNSYKFQHALDSHMRRHRNEKPFSCEFCNRAFVANVELRRHMRVHTGQKPYGCHYCSRRFSDFGSRIKHERTHTGERPYQCPTCEKTFAYAHVLSVHVLTHTGEKRFKCDVCGKGFTKKIYLNTHMNHHNVPIIKLEEHDSVGISGNFEPQQNVLKIEKAELSFEDCKPITIIAKT